MRLVLLPLLLLGCSSAAPFCNASTCSGCCDANDACQTGDSTSACGSLGNLCASCGQSAVCSLGTCVSTLGMPVTPPPPPPDAGMPVRTCAPSASQPDVCEYGQSCSATGTCEPVPQATGDCPAFSKRISFWPYATRGAVIYFVRHTAAKQGCSATFPYLHHVDLKAYAPAGSTGAEVFDGLQIQYSSSDDSTFATDFVDMHTAAGRQLNVTLTFCSETGDPGAHGLFFPNGNEVCLQ